MNPRSSGYEPDELPDCSTPRRQTQYTRPAKPRQPVPIRLSLARLEDSLPTHDIGLMKVQSATVKVSGVTSSIVLEGGYTYANPPAV